MKKQPFQTMFFVSKLPKVLRQVVQKFCGLIMGHRQSLTDWGYAGGEYAETWCRWCNKKLYVKRESLWFVDPRIREYMRMVDSPPPGPEVEI